MGGQRRPNGRFGEFGSGWRVAVEALHVNRVHLFYIFHQNGIVFAAEGSTGVVAQFLRRGDLAIKTAKKVNEPGVIVEVSFGVIGSGEFLKEDLREAGSGGLEADFGEFRGIVAAEEIEQVILVETVLEDVLLFEPPFEVAAGGPV
jgi:hypothetical protein